MQMRGFVPICRIVVRVVYGILFTTHLDLLLVVSFLFFSFFFPLVRIRRAWDVFMCNYIRTTYDGGGGGGSFSSGLVLRIASLKGAATIIITIVDVSVE